MLRYPFTIIALVLSAMVSAAALLWDVNLIEIPLALLDRFERRGAGAVGTLILAVASAFIADSAVVVGQRRRELSLEIERLRIVKVTIRTVQDIVNNSLNQLQLVRIEAEGHVPEATLLLFDGAIQETAAKLTALGDLEAYTERQMVAGPGLSYGPATYPHST